MSEIAYADIRSELNLTLSRLGLPDKDSSKGGLTLAIATYKGNLITLCNGKFCFREYSVRSETLAHALYLCHDLTGARSWRELDVERSQILLLDLYTLQLVELLDARLHLI